MRVALWRAMHVEVDAAPPVLDDVVGLQLAAPDDNWRERPDMHPLGTRGFRASIVARADGRGDLQVGWRQALQVKHLARAQCLANHPFATRERVAGLRSGG